MGTRPSMGQISKCHKGGELCILIVVKTLIGTKFMCDWNEYIYNVNVHSLQGCSQVAKAMSVPPGAILGGLLILTSFVISPAAVTVPGTDWVEPALIWLTISMPTGSRKTTVYQF